MTRTLPPGGHGAHVPAFPEPSVEQYIANAGGMLEIAPAPPPANGPHVPGFPVPSLDQYIAAGGGTRERVWLRAEMVKSSSRGSQKRIVNTLHTQKRDALIIDCFFGIM